MRLLHGALVILVLLQTDVSVVMCLSGACVAPIDEVHMKPCYVTATMIGGT